MVRFHAPMQYIRLRRRAGLQGLVAAGGSSVGQPRFRPNHRLTGVYLQCRLQCMVSGRADAQITFRLPRRIAEHLGRIASRRGVQRSDLLRDAVLRLVAEDEGLIDHFGAVKDLIGALRSGVPDLGSDHRRHLKRAFGRSSRGR